MVSRLALACILAALTASCTTMADSPSASFCELTTKRLPITAKRTDDPQTIRQIVQINSMHMTLCGSKK